MFSLGKSTTISRPQYRTRESRFLLFQQKSQSVIFTWQDSGATEKLILSLEENTTSRVLIASRTSTIRFTVLERNVIFRFHILGEKNSPGILMKIVVKYQFGKDKFELTLEKINSLENQDKGNSILAILSIIKQYIYYLEKKIINFRKT